MVDDTPSSSGTVTASATASTSMNGHHHHTDGVEDDPTGLHSLLAVSVIVIQQAIDMLNNQVLHDAQLTYQSTYMPGSTIGKHLRHARDHFVLLLDSIGDNGKPCHELSYDTRIRNTPMEVSRTAALEAFQLCVERLKEIVPKTHLDDQLTLNAVTPYMHSFKSSFGRELWFASLHAVHHWSSIRVIAGEQNLKLEDSFGVAPSTLIYHGSEGPLGKAKSRI